jgi:GT2 family glycosyltransferase
VPLEVPLNVVSQELAVWSSQYARLRAEVEAKEAEIQTLAAATQQQAAELVAKEKVIQQLLAFRYLSPGYWLFRGRRLATRFLKPLLTAHLGNLVQYAPRPLHVPNWYTAQPAPTPAPVISIVTPAFNQAHFLERTMQSVLTQNYPALEYIIQDGGSIDGTPALLNRYRDQLAHAESAPDNGQAHAINLGFARATGELMAWLNADDLLLPGALNTVAAYFAQHPQVDVVYGHRVMIDENDDEIGRWILPPHNGKILHWADYIPQETLFWRRRIWEKSGGYLDESYKFALDWDLLLRFQEAGAKMVRLPRFLGAFRVHPAQKTSAQLNNVGATEMARLRQQCHGRSVSQAEIGRGIGPYLTKSLVYHSLYRWGLRRY